ncbi:hypothetical protein GCM10009847_25580 [Leucobacter tardus]|uniref:Helix-turn-helix domain-containing protein n=1 Tax=Leucobacter tardus TaxID=501483 RepID=A0A939QH03_9MICO|nr:helix-turn-helix domain-containing protein [Leucobacter tardus]MBO2989933.1 helix-turn-helix domain-containing protein [Leucobacter tardus]
MIAQRDSFEAMSWQREESEPQRIDRQAFEGLTRDLEGRSGDMVIQLNADMVRSLLAAHQRPESRHGARIRDDERGVTYNVTIDREGGAARLRTVEVVPDEGVDNPAVFRLPTQLLATLAAEVLADSEAGYFAMGVRADPDTQRKPSAAELADLAGKDGAGWTRHMIAEAFDRNLSTVDQWLRRARKELPDRFEPQRRGPKPKTPDAPAPGNSENGETENE